MGWDLVLMVVDEGVTEEVSLEAYRSVSIVVDDGVKASVQWLASWCIIGASDI